MSAKDRLGTKSSNPRAGPSNPGTSGTVHDRLGRRHVLDRINPIPDADHSNHLEFDLPPIRSRLGNTNLMPREAQRKSRKARDQASSCQSYPRDAKSKEFLAALCGRRVNTGKRQTESEEEDDESSKTYKPKPKSK